MQMSSNVFYAVSKSIHGASYSVTLQKLERKELEIILSSF